ncbi:AGAP010695-PA, partial [Anopheles gambiae str. PEST]
MTSTNISESIPFYDVFGYYEWTLTLADPRTKGWPMVDSPIPTLTGVCIYLFIVWIGPKLMHDAECVYPIVDAVWWYYFSKVLEFSDTFFFILRKKDNQLTFLHVYHHSTMFSFWWIGVKWVPSGSTFLPAMVNSFIHVLMYTYYGLAAVGPHMNKYLWWKKYLTILQLIQFTVAMMLGINGIITGCEFPLWMHYTLIGYMISFILLFGNFYAQAYMQGKPIQQFE